MCTVTNCNTKYVVVVRRLLNIQLSIHSVQICTRRNTHKKQQNAKMYIFMNLTRGPVADAKIGNQNQKLIAITCNAYRKVMDTAENYGEYIHCMCVCCHSSIWACLVCSFHAHIHIHHSYFVQRQTHTNQQHYYGLYKVTTKTDRICENVEIKLKCFLC